MSESLYHGTDEFSKDSIIQDGINLNQNPRGGDFAVGFYLTPEIGTAVAMALRKAYGNARPSVVEITLQKDFKRHLKVKDFGHLSLQSSEESILNWAQFIVNNRNGMDYINAVSKKLGCDDNNIDKRYDIVIGTIADGSVTRISRRCKQEKRIVTIHEAKEFLDKSFGIQYCISTEFGLTMIQNQPREKKGVPWI